MTPTGPGDRFDAFRALADRSGRPGQRLLESLAGSRAGTGEDPGAERPGLRIPDMFAAARSGALRALWITGEDVCATDPDTDQVARALDACPLVVCNELFLSETARRADVVLPVASWLEKYGTSVNIDPNTPMSSRPAPSAR